MSVTKVINIEVNDGELNKLNSDLNKVDKSFDKLDGSQEKVAKSSNKAAKGLKDVGDNGGAIAVLDSLTGGLATKVRDAAEASKLFNISLKATRGALIATGIGAFVVALGLVVAYWDEIVELVTGVNKELEEQKRLNDDINKQLERQNFLRESNAKFIDNETEEAVLRAKIAGASEKDIFKIREQGAKNRIAIAQQEADEANRILAQSAGADAETYEAAQKQQEEAFKKLGEARSTLVKTQLDEELRLKESQSTSSGRGKIKSVGDVLSAEEQDALLSKKQEQFEQIFDLERLQQEQLNELGKAGLEQALNDESIAQAKRAESAKRYAELQIKIAEEEAEQKRRVLSSQADALFAFSDLLQVLGEENKGIAIAGLVAEQIASTAKIIVATGEANAKAAAESPLTLGQPFVTLNTIAAGLSIATGVAATVKAISQLGGSGGGVSAGSNLGNGGQQAPSFNVVGTSGTNQLAETLGQDQNPIQAFVVGSNVTTQQELDRNIVQTATIG